MAHPERELGFTYRGKQYVIDGDRADEYSGKAYQQTFNRCYDRLLVKYRDEEVLLEEAFGKANEEADKRASRAGRKADEKMVGHLIRMAIWRMKEQKKAAA